MIQLNAGNVLLKPSQRKQLMTWLKRSLRFGQRMAGFVMSITMHRAGKFVEITASVSGKSVQTTFRSRQTDWSDAARDLVRKLTSYLHDQSVHGMLA